MAGKGQLMLMMPASGPLVGQGLANDAHDAHSKPGFSLGWGRAADTHDARLRAFRRARVWQMMLRCSPLGLGGARAWELMFRMLPRCGAGHPEKHHLSPSL